MNPELPEMTPDRVHRLRAVEALRAGVPNRDVARYFPPHQTDVETRWNAALEKAGAGEVAAGLLLEGDFGVGKSHWLERFEHLALGNNWGLFDRGAQQRNAVARFEQIAGRGGAKRDAGRAQRPGVVGDRA